MAVVPIDRWLWETVCRRDGHGMTGAYRSGRGMPRNYHPFSRDGRGMPRNYNPLGND